MSYGQPLQPQDSIPQFTAFDLPVDLPLALTDGLFDATAASSEQLVRLGLPPRPDARRQPLLRQAWNRAFSRPVKVEPFAPAPDPIKFRTSVRRLNVLRVSQTRFEGSRNWSGAYITANRGRHLLQVWGLWQIPDGLTVPPPPLDGDPGKPYKVGTWIGLDGQRRYFDASLPQIGTVSVLNADGTRDAQAWVQWWAKDELKLKLKTLSLKVQPGQTVLCVLTALGPQEVAALIVNLSTIPITAQPVRITPPMARLPSGSGAAQPKIAGATAEWIVERPSDLDLPRFENFPDYGQTQFEFCGAVEGRHADLPSLLQGLPIGLQGARDIRMFQTLRDPARTRYISMPHKIDDSTLRVRYGGFQSGP